MGFMTALMGLGLALSAAGTVTGMVGQQKQAKAQKQSIIAQQQAEEARKKQMNLDADRKRRSAIRDAQIARATALTNATNQGAGEGSGLQGGFGQISGQANTNIVGINQNQELGQDVFAANEAGLRANMASASAGSMVAMGQGITSLGGSLIRNGPTIAKIGGWA